MKKNIIRADDETSKQNQNTFQRTRFATAKAGGFSKANYQVGVPHVLYVQLDAPLVFTGSLEFGTSHCNSYLNILSEK